MKIIKSYRLDPEDYKRIEQIKIKIQKLTPININNSEIIRLAIRELYEKYCPK